MIKVKPGKRIKICQILIVWLLTLAVFSGVFAAENSDWLSITVNYSGAETDLQTITADYSDDWLLAPADEYNHKLMQASFVLAAASFRDKTKDLSHRDFNILDFYSKAGFIQARTIDFNVIPSIDTIGTAIAHKVVGDCTLIAVSISGNNYQGEWAGNVTVDDDNRVKGFNDAADKVTERLNKYIREHGLHGNLRLWTAGYSRSAAVTNDFAADATDSGLFQAVYAYTFGTPRTTREENADRYRNIFNLLIPFDMVPMVPFPEWGFHRYGIDLFLPALETDSDWYNLQNEALQIFESVSDEEIVINPQINKNLHTVFDYLAYFISSAESYKNTFQVPLVNFMETHDFQALLNEIFKSINFDAIREGILLRSEILRYQMHEFYNFLDFIQQFIYTSLIGNYFEDVETIIWDPRISVQENLAFNHYDKTYRSWLFSTDDGASILSREAKYAHVVIKGDADVDVFDDNLDFVVHINNQSGSYSFETQAVRMPSFSGGISERYVYFERQEGQTLVVLPMDRIYHLGIYSHKDQTIRVSFTAYTTDKLRADVFYIYNDEYDEGEYFLETFDPEKENSYTAADLQEMGVLVIEPWSKNIVYSPTAVMRLENEGIPHPSPKILLCFIGFVLVLIIILVILMVLGICKIIKKFLKKPGALLTHKKARAE